MKKSKSHTRHISASSRTTGLNTAKSSDFANWEFRDRVHNTAKEIQKVYREKRDAQAKVKALELRIERLRQLQLKDNKKQRDAEERQELIKGIRKEHVMVRNKLAKQDKEKQDNLNSFREQNKITESSRRLRVERNVKMVTKKRQVAGKKSKQALEIDEKYRLEDIEEQQKKVRDKAQEAYKKSLIKNRGQIPGIIKEDPKRTKKFIQKIQKTEEDTLIIMRSKNALLQTEKELLEGLQRAKASQKEAYHRFEEL